MNIQRAKKLCDVYDELFIAVLRKNDVLNWPLSGGTYETKELIDFLTVLADKGDVWAKYYIQIVSLLDRLMDIDRPKESI